MLKKIYIIHFFLLISFYVFGQNKADNRLYEPDPRDSSYPFIGEWKITETFKLAPQWAADIFDEKERRHIRETQFPQDLQFAFEIGQNIAKKACD